MEQIYHTKGNWLSTCICNPYRKINSGKEDEKECVCEYEIYPFFVMEGFENSNNG